MSEQDLQLKLRMDRTLWAAGYYTRSNVKLASPLNRTSSGGRTAADLTDVDVFAIKFLEDLTPRRTAVDCKTGRGVSPIGRAFWLKGVMDHIAAERGYVVLARDIPEYQREAASHLAITLMDEAAINTFESRYPALVSGLRIGDMATHKYLEGNLTTLPHELDRIVEFRNTAFWYYTPSRAIMRAVELVSRAASKIDLRQKFQQALLVDVITLFSLAMLTLAHEIILLSPDDLPTSLRAIMFGGPEGVAKREQAIRGIESLVAKMSQQARLPTDDSVFQLDPSYLPTLAEALVRIIARPPAASEALRHLKVRLLHGVLYGEWDVESIMKEDYFPLADKLATDLALAFLRSCGLNGDAPRTLKFV
jgi:hypothetical protein